mgnify:CR=1 FL=1
MFLIFVKVIENLSLNLHALTKQLQRLNRVATQAYINSAFIQ